MLMYVRSSLVPDLGELLLNFGAARDLGVFEKYWW
jgi:hypothetical protein